ncbi:integral membrane protein [Dactylonectria macrodidyma]|uniref:Integral membrane protein n=1 Tax=Dactylonectria macrodidyma TaxID=307937 RepID=A0A9P9EBB5_9HYPO|nr:integral membrane protein [Dactylonectria macrodidyma]
MGITRNAFDKFAALCGPLAILFFFIGLPGAGWLPPIPPSRSPERVVEHYKSHETGIKAGSALMTFVGFFFPMYTSAISGQLSRIPGVPTTVLNAQLLGGCLGGLFLCLPAYFFAATAYRLERPPELTQLLNDVSWILFAMPFASLLAQDLAFSYAILLDRRPRPLFPRWLSFVTTGLTLTFWPAIGVHCVRSGAVAWNGGLAFWTAGVGGGVQIIVISIFVWKAIDRIDLPANGSIE